MAAPMRSHHTARQNPVVYSHQLQNFLDDRDEHSIARHLAAQSSWPASHPHSGPGCYGFKDDVGTSLLVSGSDCTCQSGTPSQDLPGLTRETSVADRSVSTSIGTRQLNRQRILETDAGGNLVLPNVLEPRVLECPFYQLNCGMTFSNTEDWISHSLGHFKNVPPPAKNRCCFCPQEFNCYCSTKECSWRQRMKHIAFHHQLGFRVATARPDFELITYLWNHKLISVADYRDLKGNNRDSSQIPVTETEKSHRRKDRVSKI
ncbi:hypothetical protein MMC07_008350 [Pseudocyphellaria aurata]|nr:hypothetical protein [Pseudocyphellaria aurata]